MLVFVKLVVYFYSVIARNVSCIYFRVDTTYNSDVSKLFSLMSETFDLFFFLDLFLNTFTGWAE